MEFAKVQQVLVQVAQRTEGEIGKFKWYYQNFTQDLCLEGNYIFSKSKRGVFLKKNHENSKKFIVFIVYFNQFAVTIGITIGIGKEDLQWANICIHLYSPLIVFSVKTIAEGQEFVTIQLFKTLYLPSKQKNVVSYFQNLPIFQTIEGSIRSHVSH